jgi:glycosyltransferase involved in cell wall biosynthesis
MEIVRYSPKERNIPNYAGEDALIRFYKDPAEWFGWTGKLPTIINITQNLAQRDPFTNWGFWELATKGMRRMPLGPGSEVLGGPGTLTYDEMKGWLRGARAYLYTGTQPASYTLGLIEAMMTGIPVVSIGPEMMTVYPFGSELFEGQELVCETPTDLETTRARLKLLLDSSITASDRSTAIRKRAIELFGKDRIGHEWASYLGAP